MGVGGLRAGEVCRLDRADIRIRNGTVVLLVSGKGRKQRLVPLSGPWAVPVRSYMGAWPERGVDHEPSFWCGQPGHEDRRLTVAAVDYIVRQHARATGHTSTSAHDLRHTAASLAIDAGEPLDRLRDRLGHLSVLVTSRYLHVCVSAASGEVAQYRGPIADRFTRHALLIPTLSEIARSSMVSRW
jgi:integrase/recombinase XerD